MARTGLILSSSVCFLPTIQARPAITPGNSLYTLPDNNANAYQNYILHKCKALCMTTITFQFCEFKKIHIPCNGDIRETYFHAVCVTASDKRSPVVERIGRTETRVITPYLTWWTPWINHLLFHFLCLPFIRHPLFILLNILNIICCDFRKPYVSCNSKCFDLDFRSMGSPIHTAHCGALQSICTVYDLHISSSWSKALISSWWR